MGRRPRTQILRILCILAWLGVAALCARSSRPAQGDEVRDQREAVTADEASPEQASPGVRCRVTDDAETTDDGPPTMRPASFLQPLPRVTPPQELQPQTPTPRAAYERASSLFGSVRADRSALTGARRGRAEVPNADIIFGSEATLRLSTDVGSLLGESQGVLGVPVQCLTPVVSEPRIHSSRVGRTAAAGSYWVPARLDLDTMVSKLDSRIIEDLIVIKGHYSVLYGPGFSFLDVDLKDAPRYAEGLEIHGSTSADYRANGRQIYGDRKSVV